jgi:integrase
MEGERIARNPARIVRKVKRGARREVRPLAPGTVEALRAASGERDAALISVLAYAGLRPQKALALSWAHVRDRTLLVERAASLGELRDTMTRSHRTVRLLAPLAEDLAAWRRCCGQSGDSAVVFAGPGGRLWTKTDWDNWVAERSIAPARRSRWTAPGRMTCVTASRRCCCTRAGR